MGKTNRTSLICRSIGRQKSVVSAFAVLLLTAIPTSIILMAMDHDQRFKTLIREFFDDFLLLFFADWAARLDLSSVEWLDKELYHDPPEGSRHVLDLVARVPIATATEPTVTASLLLVHIEIEAPDRTTQLTPRLPYYYHFLRLDFDVNQ